MESKSKGKKGRLVLVLAGIAVFLLVLSATDIPGSLTDVEQVRQKVEAGGALGPIVFVGLCIALFAIFQVAWAVWASPLLWPISLAYAYSLFAVVTASIGTYMIVRWSSHTWIRDRVPDGIRRFEIRLESRPFLTVFLLRLLFWANPLVDMLIALSTVPLRIYVTATLVGLAVSTAFFIAVGQAAFEAVEHLSSQEIIPVLIMTVLVIFITFVLMRLKRLRLSKARQAKSGD